MRRTIVLLTLTGFTSLILACDQPVKHYTSMGCVPSEQKSEKGCPLSYDCPNLVNRQKDKCYLFGKIYDIHEKVPSKETSGFCTALVACEGDIQQSAGFIYTHIDCADFFKPRDPDCVYQYEPNECCSSGTVCGEDREKLANCTIDGTSFREGELMYIPNKPCQKCICSAGFDMTKTDQNDNCFESKCSFELHEVEQLYGGGAPVYKDGHCCPWFWRMPLKTDTIKEKSTGSQHLDGTCKYGNLTLGIGDSLENINDSDGKIECSCAIPPLVHCQLR